MAATCSKSKDKEKAASNSPPSPLPSEEKTSHETSQLETEYAPIDKNLAVSPSLTTMPPRYTLILSREVPAKVFELYPKLSKELQIMIWKLAVQDTRNRIVIWASPVIPPLIHACKLSREIFLKENQVEHWEDSPYMRPHTWWVNWDHNIIHFKDLVPGMAGWDIEPRLKHWKPCKCCVPNVYHRVDNMSHFRIQNQWTPPGEKWLENIRYMVLNMSYVKTFYNLRTNRPFRGWERLNEICPRLEILYILPENSRDIHVNDKLENLSECSWDYSNAEYFGNDVQWAGYIADQFRRAIENGMFQGLVLKFVQTRDHDLAVRGLLEPRTTKP